MRCRGKGCAAPAAETFELTRDGEAFGTGLLCEQCMTRALDGAAQLRLEFEALLEAGVSRADANVTMCRRIDEMRGAS